MNVSTKKSLGYSSCSGVCCDSYKLNALIIYEIDDIMKAIHIPKVNHYYTYDTTQFNKYYLMIKYHVMNRIKWNIVNNNKQYVLINLLYVRLLWLIISLLVVFIITKKNI